MNIVRKMIALWERRMYEFSKYNAIALARRGNGMAKRNASLREVICERMEYWSSRIKIVSSFSTRMSNSLSERKCA